MKKRKMICIALAVAFCFCNDAGGYAYAAGEAESTAYSETIQTDTAEQESAEMPETAEMAETSETQSDEELAAYYAESVFVGDSIMLGFRNYCAKQKSFVHEIQFLAVGSYSAFNAMKPVSEKNVHPMYKGKKYQIWEAIPMIGSKRVFLQLGMNDISILGLEGARDKYKEFIGKILETSPGIEIHIVSVTYTLPDAGKGKLNNENIAKYNVLLQEMAKENGWEYIDLCTPVSDGEGNLAEDCCSDGFVHLSKKAYVIWENELAAYKEEQDAQNETETELETETEAESGTESETQTQTDSLK